MEKLQSNIRNMVLSLTIISVVAASILALVSTTTAEPIALAKKAKQEAAIRMVLPSFEEVVYDSANVEGVEYPCFKAVDVDGNMVGIAVQSVSEDGFGGPLKVMVGFDEEGTITGYQILETKETPGLGSKADVWFQKGGKGEIVGRNGENFLMVSKDGGGIDAIAGATITSRAFLQSVNSAYVVFTQKQLKQ